MVNPANPNDVRQWLLSQPSESELDASDARRMFTAYIDEGFTEAQALELTKAFVTGRAGR